MDLPDPLLRAPLHGEGLNLHAPQSKPNPPSTFNGNGDRVYQHLLRDRDATPACKGDARNGLLVCSR